MTVHPVLHPVYVDKPSGLVCVTLTEADAQALATALAHVVDRTPEGHTERLYNALVDAGVDDEHFSFVVETNVDYDPTDEDDNEHILVLDVR